MPQQPWYLCRVYGWTRYDIHFIVLANPPDLESSSFLISVCVSKLTSASSDSLGSCARSIWAMSRDEAFPERFRRVHPKLQVPVWCIIAVSIPQTLIGIIYIWNTTAFYGVTSAALALLTISYSIPIGLFLFSGRRNPNIVLGEWNCGRLGYFINTVAFFWLIFISIFLCFPIYYPANVKSMWVPFLFISFRSIGFK